MGGTVSRVAPVMLKAGLIRAATHHHGEHKDKREAYRLPPSQIDRIGQRRPKGNAEADRVHEKHCKGYHHFQNTENLLLGDSWKRYLYFG